MSLYRQQKSSKKFSERFRSRAARLGLQSSEIAEKLGVEPGAVSNWLNGANRPKPKNMRELAALLGCEIEWLTGIDLPEPAAGIMQETPLELSSWRQRALIAEKKLEVIRAVISPVNAEATAEAEELLRQAEAQADLKSKDIPATGPRPLGVFADPNRTPVS